MLGGVADQLLLPLEVQLVEDVADVVLDGLLRDEQLRADLLVGVAPRDELRFAWARDERRRLDEANPEWAQQETITIRFDEIVGRSTRTNPSEDSPRSAIPAEG